MTESKRQVGRVAIQVNNEDLAPDILSSLDALIVEDDLVQPTMFVLRFNDPKYSISDAEQLRIGAEIKIGAAAGADGEAKVLVVGEITALEPIYEQHNQVLLVRGYDRSHRLHRGSKTRTFLKQSDSDIAAQIAREVGLRPDTESSGTAHDYVIQDNQTEMQFLRGRAARIGFQVVVDDQKLRFRRAESAPPKATAQTWGTTLLSFRARLTAAAQPNELQVRGWDPKAKRAIVGKAKRPAQPWKIGDANNGGQVAERAFGKAATRVISDQPVRTQGEADALAQAMLDEMSEGYLSAEGACLGEPSIRAGSLLDLTGLGKRFSGSYFITASRHRYSAREGYETTFFVNGRHAGGLLAAIDGTQPRATTGGVVVGIVTNNNDPDKLGRVKLKFPWLDEDHESDWARLAAPGAGDGRGLMLVPEVDDEVLVAFDHGDTGLPYVIGGLWNGKDKAATGEAVQSGKVQQRIFKTRAGHSITISDKDSAGQIEIKTAKHTVTLDDSGQGKLTAKSAKHTITLDDSGLGKIVLESGGDLELKGSGGKLSISATGVELSSTAMLDVKANGILTVQGSLVKIN